MVESSVAAPERDALLATKLHMPASRGSSRRSAPARRPRASRSAAWPGSSVPSLPGPQAPDPGPSGIIDPLTSRGLAS